MTKKTISELVQKPENADLVAVITTYTFNAVPEKYRTDEYYLWNVSVEYRGKSRYAVISGSKTLSDKGTWDYEPLNSSRTKEYKKTHRFPLIEALQKAEEISHEITVNGLKPADYATINRLKKQFNKKHPEHSESSYTEKENAFLNYAEQIEQKHTEAVQLVLARRRNHLLQNQK